MATTHTLTFDDNGNARMIYSDEIAFMLDEGDATITRASNVEPAAGGGWEADMGPSDGPVLGPFKLRSEALDAEVAWLKKNRGL